MQAADALAAAARAAADVQQTAVDGGKQYTATVDVTFSELGEPQNIVAP